MIFEEQFPVPRNTAASKIANNCGPDHNKFLIQLWWQFFTIFVYGDVVYAQTWEVLTLKNCIEPP